MYVRDKIKLLVFFHMYKQTCSLHTFFLYFCSFFFFAALFAIDHSQHHTDLFSPSQQVTITMYQNFFQLQVDVSLYLIVVLRRRQHDRQIINEIRYLLHFFVVVIVFYLIRLGKDNFLSCILHERLNSGYFSLFYMQILL